MTLVSLDQVEERTVEWLWSARIPRGAITLLDGDGGVGKSTLALNIAAAVSAGRPVCSGEAAVRGGVLILGEEDDYSVTVKPRLIGMGAALERIVYFKDEEVTLARDLGLIEQHVVERDVKLIVIDPLSGFIGADNNREQSVRPVLTALAKMAVRRNVVVLGLRHLAKSRGSAHHAGLGSVGIGAVARAGLVMARDPAGSGHVILAQTKSNLSGPAPSLAVRFLGGVLNVIEESKHRADDLMRVGTHNEQSALGEAVEFLREELSGGGLLVNDVKKRAAQAGVTYATMRKAKDALEIKPRKLPVPNGPWIWHLPGDERLAAGVPDLNAGGDEGGEGAPRSEGHLRPTSHDAVEDAPRVEEHLRGNERTEPARSPDGAPATEDSKTVMIDEHRTHDGMRFSLLEVD